MKKIYFFSIVGILLISLIPIILAQKPKQTNMDTHWKKVKSYAEKNLPESALKEIENILYQAVKEKNSPEIIKAMVNKMRFVLDKNPDEKEKLIAEFENYTEKSTNSIEKAVMHSMTAELYQKYYEQNEYQINSRTELSGYIPKDMQEWTKNLFEDKVLKHANLSLSDVKLLQNTPSSVYESIIISGKDSKMLQPTLFDFLAYRKINLLYEIQEEEQEQMTADDTLDKEMNVDSDILNTFNQIIEFNRDKRNLVAQLFAELQKLEYQNPKKDARYLEELDKLEKKYLRNEAVVEVLAEKANYYLSQEDELDDETLVSDAKKKAYEIVDAGIKQFPKYKRIGLLENIKKQILNKSLFVSYNRIAKPHSKIELNISSQNIKELQLIIYKLNTTAMEYQTYLKNKNNDKSLFPKRTQIESRSIALRSDSYFNVVNTEFEFQAGDYGIYEFVLEEKERSKTKEKAIGSFITTDFATIQRNGTDKLTEIFVLDRKAGNPLSEVTVMHYTGNWKGGAYNISKMGKQSTNSEGYVKLKLSENSNSYLFFEKGNDRFFSSESYNYAYGYQSSSTKDQDKKSTALFTDRSLYRPGQTLYFKGIVYKSFKQEVVSDEMAKVELFNVNGEKVGEKTLKTNEFGSFSGEFVLPESGLNGAYRLTAGGQNLSVYVEEYKRPTFEVIINQAKDEVRFGDVLTLSGEAKAYAGYAIADAQVQYRVVRRSHHFWWWYFEPEKIIDSGIVKSDAKGNFEISFTPIKPAIAENVWWRENTDQFYTYFVYVDVTDPKGETQSGETIVSVGDKSLFILAEVPRKVEKSQTFSLDVITQTLNGETIISDIDYTLIGLQANDEYYEELNDTSKLKELKTVLSGKLNTKDKLTLDLKKLNSGIYKLVLKTKDNLGKEVKEEKRFVIYSHNDKKPAVKTYNWILAPKTEVNYGESAQIKFGTSTKNTDVLYEIMQGNKVLERQWVKFNDEIKTFDILLKEEYGPGVTVVFTFVKDAQIFKEQIQISRKKEEKILSPSIAVFRDKLQPGEKAEWTFHIPQARNDKKVEMLVGMYDASLDAIRPHSWSFDPAYVEFIPYTSAWKFQANEQNNLYTQFEQNLKLVPEYELDQLNWFDLPLGYGRYYAHPRMLSLSKNNMLKESVLLEESSAKLQNEVVASDSEAQEEVEMLGKPKPKVRENFHETAFFYPQLHTDKDGNVKISFVVPESLTRWNVKMLAHSKDLFYGQNELQAITQKELMVQMNLPRFVRKSDKLVLAANVTNLTEQEQLVDVRVELIDPQTNKMILPFEIKKEISIHANGTATVDWEMPKMRDFDLIVVKVIAQNEQFADGEQKYLPILPDQILVTESQALTMRANETRTFHFDRFMQNMNTVRSENFTVEFASNPAWYAVQALPLLAEPKNDNAIDYMTAYYVNSLASYIALSNPKLKSVFDQWKNAGGSREALLSNLEKNQELKNMLLDETPWVAEAKDETEQKKRIALLFDLNFQPMKVNKYFDKLLEMQLPGGGFAWYKGMRENRYITQEILLNLARLRKMTKSNPSLNETKMIHKALKYLDLEINKDFVALKKWNKNYKASNVIDNLQLFYLLLRSEYKDIPVAEQAKDAVAFYTAQSEKYWTSWTLYGKAMMATVAHRNGNSIIANDILKSLKENALHSDEMGMYWAKNVTGVWWYQRPVATQTAIIEAVSEITQNQKDIDEMKIWLLKQKQTQLWDAPLNTVNAIYTLLNYGTDWISSTGNTLIKLGNTELKPQSIEAGTGYFKETIPVNTLKSEMGQIKVSTHNSTSIAWGAAYWQYYQDLDKITSYTKEMSVSKKLFVERVAGGKKTIRPIEQTTLKKGDKVITRLVLTTDRDLEFVALKDLRAACFEPLAQTSGYQWREGAGYYYSIKDASTQYFFDYLSKGTYVFEYEVWVNNLGSFTSGITSVQCLYAPEFVTHSAGEKLEIE